MPENGDDFDFGSASDMWKNIYGHNLNGVDIENLAVSLDDGPGATTTDTNSVNDNYDSYVKLPGGVILQWGHIYDTSSPRYVAFPTQFPNVIHSVVCSTNRNSGGSNGYNHVYNYDRNGVELILDGNYGFWIAIGH